MGGESRVTNNSGADIVLILKRGDGYCSYGEIKVKKGETAKVDGRELRDKFTLTREVSFWSVYHLDNSNARIYTGLKFAPYQLIPGKIIHIKNEVGWVAEEATPTQNWHLSSLRSIIRWFAEDVPRTQN